jgi:hypothetical protein
MKACAMLTNRCHEWRILNNSASVLVVETFPARRAMDLNARCREHVLAVDDTTPHEAVVAVLKKCEQMRAESGDRGVGHFIATEFEQTIADALGINHS